MRGRALIGLTSRAGHEDVDKHNGERGKRHCDRNKGTRPPNHCSRIHFVPSIHQESNENILSFMIDPLALIHLATRPS
jgi:hypothetical protein